MINIKDLKKAVEKGIQDGGSFVAEKAKTIADDPSKTFENVKDAVGKGLNDAGDFVADKAKVVAGGTNQAFDKAKAVTIDQLDQDNSGKVDITDIIILGMKTPGIRIERAEFLQKELFKNHPQAVIDKAIATTPALAGISSEEIEKLVNEVMKYERTCVSGISAALGMPGGVLMAATIPSDIVQYYGCMLRAAQKMMYLYGFPQIETSEDGVMIDSETINSLIICLGAMYGVAGASNAVKAMAKALATGVEKQLLRKALTKGTIYPIVKSVAKWFGVKMTKEVFAGFFKNAIPVVGGVIGGGITFLSFGPCCERLKDALQDTMLSNPENHISTDEENKMYQDIENGIIDAEFDEVEVVIE